MTTPIAQGPVDVNVSHQVTEKMIDAFIDFADKTTYLSHPDVPYHGTANGDSEDAWRRRVVKAALTAAMMANGEVRGASRLAGEASASTVVLCGKEKT